MTGAADRPAPAGEAARFARSWMLLPATRPAIGETGADAVILDLEDGIDPRDRPAARAAVAAHLAEDGRAWVRISPHGSADWALDLDEVSGVAGLQGVVLAKSESADQVEATADALDGAVPVIPLVESALGVEHAVAIARARGVLRLAFGSGDYRGDTGASDTEIALAYPRSRLVAASAVAGLSGPIDGPSPARADEGAVHARATAAASLGMRGSLCLTSDHARAVERAFTPALADTVEARRFIEEFDSRGRLVMDGSDLPRLRRAEMIDRLARAYGV